MKEGSKVKCDPDTTFMQYGFLKFLSHNKPLIIHEILGLQVLRTTIESEEEVKGKFLNQQKNRV